jgi:type I restriction enzyme S subunit
MIFSSFISDEIRACILPKLETRAIAKADCFCIRPNEKLVDKRFLLFSLVSGNAYNQLVLNIHGATRPRINTTQLKSLLLSIPSIDEQKEIVKRIQELFSFANKIEDRYMKAKTHFDKLPQSILAKAFRGELVPQDSDEEPANLLLDRILTAKRIKK